MGIHYSEDREQFEFIDYFGKVTDSDTNEALLISRHSIDLSDTLGWEIIPEEPENN